MTAMLGSSILFAQTAMAADTAEQTEDTAKADETSEEKTEELKTIGEKPEKETEGILDVKLKNLTGKVITGFTIKNEKDSISCIYGCNGFISFGTDQLPRGRLCRSFGGCQVRKQIGVYGLLHQLVRSLQIDGV